MKSNVVFLTFENPINLYEIKELLGPILTKTYPDIEFVFTQKKIEPISKVEIRDMLKSVGFELKT